jgi:hypothetical protein
MKTTKTVVASIVVIGVLLLLLRTIPGVRFITDFFTPIVFYGKAVDETGNPVPSADVVISFVDTPGPGEGHTKEKIKTDSQGRFWTWGHGLAIVVNVSKTAYYTLDKSGGSFSYCEDGGKPDRHTSSSNAAIFVLRKTGETEPLVVTKGNIEISRDGTPRQMKLTTGKLWIVPDGDIVFQAWISDQALQVNSNKPYDWKCKISVPGGGIQQRTGEFDFTAPDNGYQPSDEIDMPATTPQWRSNASRSYFIQLKNGDYARMEFTLGTGGYNDFEITAYLNPQSGHRNLESNASMP